MFSNCSRHRSCIHGSLMILHRSLQAYPIGSLEISRVKRNGPANLDFVNLGSALEELEGWHGSDTVLGRNILASINVHF